MIQEVMTRLARMNLVEKFLFDETMENKEAYEAMVSILLENEVHLLARTETEKELRVSPELRSIRLDVVGMDDKNVVYFMEMQQKNTKNLEKRSRYYQGHIDVSLLPTGEADFNKLPDSCFILVAPFDIFGKGLYRYTFVGTCIECPELRLQDGAVKIFINTKGMNPEMFSQEFLDLMEYVTKSEDEVVERSESKRLRILHECVKKVKGSEKVGVKLMQTWEEYVMIKEEGRAEGREVGRAEGRAEAIRVLIETCKELKMSLEDTRNKIIEKLSLDDKEAEQLLKKYWCL